MSILAKLRLGESERGRKRSPLFGSFYKPSFSLSNGAELLLDRGNEMTFSNGKTCGYARFINHIKSSRSENKLKFHQRFRTFLPLVARLIDDWESWHENASFVPSVSANVLKPNL